MNRVFLAIAVAFAALFAVSPEPNAKPAIPCDINGDGFSELLVGSPGATSAGIAGAGSLAIYWGSPTGLLAEPVALRVGADGLPGQPQADAGFGAAFDCGDFTGDGDADIAVGAPGETVGGQSGAGAIYLITGIGSAGNAASARRTATQLGTVPRARGGIGSSIAIDPSMRRVAVGEPGSARLYVLSDITYASPGWVTAKRAPRLIGLGTDLAWGDVVGDAAVDLVGGAPGTSVSGKPGAGAVAIWPAGDLNAAHLLIHRDSPGVGGIAKRNARFGAAVAIGNWDGRGQADLAVGSPRHHLVGAKRGGEVLVLSPQATTKHRTLERFTLNRAALKVQTGDLFGWAVAMSDVDGDGRSELLVGAPRRDTSLPDDGLVVAFDGDLEFAVADRASLGLEPQTGNGLGAAIGTGDYDGNGRGDLALGMPGASGDQLRHGALALVYGRRTLHLDPPARRIGGFHGQVRGEGFGVVGAGSLPASAPVAAVAVGRRGAWQARDFIADRMEKHAIKRLTIHHAWNDRGDSGAAALRGWQSWHMDGQGWGDIAYHLIIGKDGSVFDGRPLRFAGDTGTNYNPSGHLLVVLEGHFDREHPTTAQLESLTEVVAWAVGAYELDLDELSGHRDHASTTCPGDNLHAIIASGSLAQDVAALLELGPVIRHR